MILLFGIHTLPVAFLLILVFQFILSFFFKFSKNLLRPLKLIRLYVILAFTASLFGILFYLTQGILRGIFGSVGLLALFLIVRYRSSDFNRDKHKSGLSFFYFFALVSMIILLMINEFHYSLNVKGINRGANPKGLRTAVALTFDDVGLKQTDPHSLTSVADYLAERGLSGTFFVAAKGLEKETCYESVKALLNRGMEIGFHGYDHRFFEFGRIFYSINSPSYEAQKKIFVKSLKIFRDKIGVEPKGFRAPVWRENRFTLQLLEEFGFKYNSGRKTLLTRQSPFYRRTNGNFSSVINMPSSGEFTWFYGPKWYRAYQYFINRQLVQLLLKRHNSNSSPYVFVFHMERLKDEFSERLFKEIIDWIAKEKNLFVSSLEALAQKKGVAQK